MTGMQSGRTTRNSDTRSIRDAGTSRSGNERDTIPAYRPATRQTSNVRGNDAVAHDTPHPNRRTEVPGAISRPGPRRHHHAATCPTHRRPAPARPHLRDPAPRRRAGAGARARRLRHGGVRRGRGDRMHRRHAAHGSRRTRRRRRPERRRSGRGPHRHERRDRPLVGRRHRAGRLRGHARRRDGPPGRDAAGSQQEPPHRLGGSGCLRSRAVPAGRTGRRWRRRRHRRRAQRLPHHRLPRVAPRSRRPPARPAPA